MAREIDLVLTSGLRIRSMEICIPGAAMILDERNDVCAIFYPPLGQWKVSNPDPRHWQQLVLSPEDVQQIAELAKPTGE